MDDPTCFDSFSEPSLACAILRQEADRLLLVAREESDWARASRARRSGGGLELPAHPAAGHGADPPSASGDRSGRQPPSIQSLRALDAQVQGVQLTLTRTLLVAYADHHMWNEVVDRYVQLLREGPGRAEAALFVHLALDCSQKCGRAEEVVDALQHLVRFHPELTFSEDLKDLLAEWKAKNPPNLALSNR